MSINIFNSDTDKYANFLDVYTMVKPWLNIAQGDTSMDFILATLANGISVNVQSFIGAPIAPKTYGPDDGLGKFSGGDGLGASYIMLPRTPVLKVLNVTEYWNQTPVELTEITQPGTTGIQDGYQVNYRTGKLTRILGGIWPRPWMPGVQNVWVTWIAGYNPIPGDILEACLEWITDKFHAQFQSNVARPLSAQEMNQDTEGGTPYKGLPYYVEQVLQHYVQPSIGG